MEDIIKEVKAFRDERNWKQYHNPKDLAISLSIEASELLENFQWKNSEESIEANSEAIKDEIADVATYLILLCEELNIDLKEAIRLKMKQNAKKYPVEKAYGSNKKYTEL
ncbi:nucleotide pyrophosphohydrolase [Vallitalea okinawensis]|uniref:nucleotide pyrophosphohydrolase n=1 Tax=Vallitalea okinawensis TaxID=2078660 RepID=UPI000CFBC30B|nr:nucleotide pyrophosphohydrolase [Vallitalea okinawensis]